MASTAPTRFDVQPGDDLGRIALAATIDRLDEQGDNISRVDWLYASTNRRALFCRAYLPAITTSSASIPGFWQITVQAIYQQRRFYHHHPG